jgi:hypothetical protein
MGLGDLMGLNGVWRGWRGWLNRWGGVAKWVVRGFTKRVTLVGPVGEAYTTTILSKWWDCAKPTI